MGPVTQSFAAGWRVRGYPNFVADDATEIWLQLIYEIDRQLDRSEVEPDSVAPLREITARFSPSFVRQDPTDVAIAVERYIATIACRILVEDDAAVATMTALSLWDTSLSPIPRTRLGGYTPTRRRQVANRTAQIALVRRSAVLAAATRILQFAPLSPQRATQLRDAFTLMFAPVIDAASIADDGAVVRGLRAVLTAAVNLLTDRIGPVNELAVFTTAITLPVHVAAHRIYQDAREAATLADANPVAHPSFMPLILLAPALT
jgi:hypothetical protein